MQGPVIFDFPDFGSFLAAWVKHRKDADAGFSYMRLARKVGSKSASLLTQIGLGRRFPTASLLHKLKGAMELGHREYDYALALVGFQRSKTQEEKDSYGEKLRRLRPRNQAVIMNLDREDLFGKWYVPVIIEMLRLPDFQADPAWIAARLGGRISTRDAKEALELGVRVGLVEYDPKGRLRPVAEHLKSPPDVPLESVRNWHRYMMGRASKALSEQQVTERYVAGTSIAIKTARLKEAQEAIREFRRTFCEEYQAQDGDQIYQFAVQFFRLTEST